MGVLDQIKENDANQERQSIMETSDRLASKFPAVEEQLTKLTTAVAELTGYTKARDEAISEHQEQPSISPQSGQPSMLGDELTKRLNEIEKTLVSIASTFNSNTTVKLPGGTSVKRSDFEAYTMMKRIEEQLQAMITVSADLAESVRKRGQVHIDTTALTEHAVKVLDSRLAKAIEEPISRMENKLDDLEERAAAVGAQQIADASKEVDRVLAQTDEVVRAVGAAGHHMDALTARITWTTAGRMCLALLPMAAVLLIVGGLTIGAFHALGIGPILGWAWESFTTAETAAQKALIALGTLAGITGFGWIATWLARKLGDEYGRW